MKSLNYQRQYDPKNPCEYKLSLFVLSIFEVISAQILK